MSELRNAVIAAVKAEWEFRCGSQAYSATAANWHENALADLRRIVTGETDLSRAGAALGKRSAPAVKRKRLRLKRDDVQMNLFKE